MSSRPFDVRRRPRTREKKKQHQESHRSQRQERHEVELDGIVCPKVAHAVGEADDMEIGELAQASELLFVGGAERLRIARDADVEDTAASRFGFVSFGVFFGHSAVIRVSRF